MLKKLCIISCILVFCTTINAMLTEDSFEALERSILTKMMEMAQELSSMPDLHRSCIKGNLRKVYALIRKEPGAVDEKWDDATPLYLAIANDHPDVALALLAAGADANSMNVKGNYTPLMVAAEEGLLNVVQELLKHGADVNQQDREGYTTLHSLASARLTQNHVAILGLLLSKLDIDVHAKTTGLIQQTALSRAQEWAHLNAGKEDGQCRQRAIELLQARMTKS